MIAQLTSFEEPDLSEPPGVPKVKELHWDRHPHQTSYPCQISFNEDFPLRGIGFQTPDSPDVCVFRRESRRVSVLVTPRAAALSPEWIACRCLSGLAFWAAVYSEIRDSIL